jgi:hypothetical protein
MFCEWPDPLRRASLLLPVSLSLSAFNKATTHCRPTEVSVLNFTFSPCAARCLVKAVLSLIPLNNFGENTSKGSEMVCVISIRPELLCQHSYSKHTHW